MIAYLDESGAHGGSFDVLTVGGFVASQARWARIEQTWNGLLKKRVFHMTDFERRYGDFEVWPREKRRIPLLAALADSVAGNVSMGVADSVVLADFRDAWCPPGAQHRHVLRLAYTFLVISCVQGILEHIEIPAGDTLSVVCEEHRGVEGMTTQTFYGLKQAIPDVGAQLGGITFLPKARFRGLQAADMIAYENFRYVSRAYAKGETHPMRTLLDRFRRSERLSAGSIRGTHFGRCGRTGHPLCPGHQDEVA